MKGPVSLIKYSPILLCLCLESSPTPQGTCIAVCYIPFSMPRFLGWRGRLLYHSSSSDDEGGTLADELNGLIGWHEFYVLFIIEFNDKE